MHATHHPLTLLPSGRSSTCQRGSLLSQTAMTLDACARSATTDRWQCHSWTSDSGAPTLSINSGICPPHSAHH